MIVGLNRVVQHQGRELHIQVEDLGLDQAAFEVRIYEGGGVLWRKRVPYDDVLSQGLPKPEQDDALRGLMERTLHTVQAGIARGKILGG